MCVCTYQHTSAGDRLQREELDRCDGTVDHPCVPTLHHTCAQWRILRDETASLVLKLKDILVQYTSFPSCNRVCHLHYEKHAKLTSFPGSPALEWENLGMRLIQNFFYCKQQMVQRSGNKARWTAYICSVLPMVASYGLERLLTHWKQNRSFLIQQD